MALTLDFFWKLESVSGLFSLAGSPVNLNPDLFASQSNKSCSLARNCKVLGAPEVSANLYCNSRTSVLGRLRDYLRLLMKRYVDDNSEKGALASRKKCISVLLSI